jgi:hypothetical protein
MPFMAAGKRAGPAGLERKESGYVQECKKTGGQHESAGKGRAMLQHDPSRQSGQ